MNTNTEKNSRIGKYAKSIIDVQKELDKTDTTPPEIDIKSEVEDYVSSLRVTASNERQTELKKFVQAKINSILTPWQNRMNGFATKMESVFDTQFAIEKDKDNVDAQIAVLENDMDRKTEQANALERQRDNNIRRLEAIKPAGRYAVWTVWILLAGVTLIGILSAYYYASVLGRIFLAQNGGTYLGMTNETFTTLGFLLAEPTNFLFIFGALVIILAGKFISIVYSNAGFPNWFMNIAVLTSVVVVTGLVALLSYSQSITVDIQLARSQVVALQSSTEELNINTGVVENICRSNPADERCLEIETLEEELEELQDSMAGNSSFSTLVTLLAEISFSAVAWMYASRHFEQNSSSSKKLVETISQQSRRLDENVEAVKSMKYEIEDLRTQQMELIGLMGKLDGLRENVWSSEKIARLRKDIEKEQLANAKMQLGIMEEKWITSGASD